MELFNDFCRAGRRVVGPGRAAPTSSPASRGSGSSTSSTSCRCPAYAELSDGARSEALRKLTFRALWWFRYAAAAHRSCSGSLLVGIQGDGENTDLYLEGVNGTAILTGMLFGITMFLNVWGVIWRNQKIVIGNAENVAAGGEANPEAPAAAKRAARASRCNTLFSIPMLWFMVFTAHGGFYRAARRDRQHHRLLGARARPVGASSRRRRSGSSAASTAPFNKRPSTSTEHDRRRLHPAGRPLLRRLGAPAPRRLARSASDARGRRPCRRPRGRRRRSRARSSRPAARRCRCRRRRRSA